MKQLAYSLRIMASPYYFFILKNYFAKWSVALLLLIFISSCSITKPSAYFKTLQEKDTTIKNIVNDNFESLIIVGDKLSISVSSMSPMEDAFFNNEAITKGNATGAVGGYLVEKDGTVLLHRLGNYTVTGLSRRQLEKKIQTSLLPYLKDPIVQVNYLNHKVTIIGEVGKPQIINMPEERISIIEALVASGDVSPTGRRDLVTIIRENGNEKTVKHINLEDHSIFSSPWFYVKPNDIILVANDNAKYLRTERRSQLQSNISFVASTLSLALIIITQVFKK